MEVAIKKWGNSQGVRIPKEFLMAAEMELNDMVDMRVANGVITISKPFRHKSLEERVKEYAGKLDLDGELDWLYPVGNEEW